MSERLSSLPPDPPAAELASSPVENSTSTDPLPNPPSVEDGRQAEASGQSDELREFVQAIRDYREESGRMFPTWSEVLEVLLSLGYEKSEEVVEVKEPKTPES
ncbi:hypothetical protein ACYOEI_13185 [Singulisphaera rosea]